MSSDKSNLIKQNVVTDIFDNNAITFVTFKIVYFFFFN